MRHPPGQRPILATGNTDGDLPIRQWTAASPHRTLQLVVQHTDAEREYAYDRDPILDSGTGQILAAASEHNWTTIDMAADWSAIYPPVPVLWRSAMQLGTSGLPGPLRRFADRLDEVRSAQALDMDQVGRALVELAADEEFFGPLIAEIPSGSPGSRWLIRPERGPRLVLVHRPEGVMGYTHSHHCWVGIAPVRGVETHQRWNAVRHDGGRAELSLTDERALVHGDVATLVPPEDVHNHGHVAGSGPSPYSLILLGDDMLLFDREEYDPERGTWQALAPGDPGRDNR